MGSETFLDKIYNATIWRAIRWWRSCLRPPGVHESNSKFQKRVLAELMAEQLQWDTDNRSNELLILAPHERPQKLR